MVDQKEIITPGPVKIIRREQREVTIVKEAVIPEWLQLALAGKKLQAIKALREAMPRKENDDLFNLVDAKNVVASIDVTTHYENLDI